MSEFYMTGASPEETWPLIRDFHYSKRMPAAAVHSFAWRESGGLFGDMGSPRAVCIFSHPVARNAPKNMLELIRLSRDDDFNEPLSKFVSWCLRWLKKNTNFDAVISYADTTEGHHGGIYQATNFTYVSEVVSGHIGYRAEDGSFIHRRTCNARFGSSGVSAVLERKPDWVPVYGKPKHLYIFPLKKKLTKVLSENNWQSIPYPKPDKNYAP